MKKVLSILAVVLMLTSCSKNKDDVSSPKQLIQTKMDFGNNTDYSYDEKGRIVKVVSGDQETVIEHTGNSRIETSRIVSLNHVVSKITYTLNEKGQAATGTGFYQFHPSQPLINVQITFTFDAAGYLVKSGMTADDGLNATIEYYYQNGNVTEEKSFLNNVFSGKKKFYYGNKLPNKLKTGAVEGQYIPGTTHLGKLNTNLKEKTEVFDKNGTITNTIQSQYEFGADEYPVKMTINTNTGSNIQYFIYNK